jgi:phenylacetate-CoA ligase
MMGVARSLSNAVAFERHDRASRQIIRNFQDRRVRELISHAYKNVPYYRSLFDRHAIRATAIRGVADLAAIPVTNKAQLQSLPVTDRIARGVDADKLIAHTTGGSTGEPFTIRRSWIEERTLGLIRRRSLKYYGLGRGDLIVVATFHHRPHRNDNRTVELLMNALGNFKVRSVSCIDPPRDLLSKLSAMRPDAIGGYAGVLARLAETVEQIGLPFAPPCFVVSGAEVLDRTSAVRISKAFNAPVYDTYGSHEFSRIAWQCMQTGSYHRADDGVVTEILVDGKNANAGEQGQLVGTALHSFAMPFIRYELGDMVTQGDDTCACGAPFSTLHDIRGRVVDYFKMPDGRMLHPYLIADALKPHALRWVGRYQLVQESVNQIVLTAVPQAQPMAEELDAAREAVQRVTGDAVSFSIDLVSHIDPGPTGKHRIYRSKVIRD